MNVLIIYILITFFTTQALGVLLMEDEPYPKQNPLNKKYNNPTKNSLKFSNKCINSEKIIYRHTGKVTFKPIFFEIFLISGNHYLDRGVYWIKELELFAIIEDTNRTSWVSSETYPSTIDHVKQVRIFQKQDTHTFRPQDVLECEVKEIDTQGSLTDITIFKKLIILKKVN